MSFDDGIDGIVGRHVRAMRDDVAVLVAFHRSKEDHSALVIRVSDGCTYCFSTVMGEKEFEAMRARMRMRITWQSFFRNLSLAIAADVSFADGPDGNLSLRCAVTFSKVETVYEFRLSPSRVEEALPQLMFDLTELVADLQDQVKRKEEELSVRPAFAAAAAHGDDVSVAASEAPAAKKPKKITATTTLMKKAKGARIK